MTPFTPQDWYWLADDGRVFTSARQAVVTADDPAYVAFKAGANPTAWPRDEAGAQTAAALQDVLTPYGLWADLAGYAAAVRYAKEIGGTTVNGMRVATDDRAKTMLIGTRIAAEADPKFTTPWVGSDGVPVTLTAEQVIGLSDAVLAHVQACFVAYGVVAAGIAATPATVTSQAQVDAAFADL